MHQHQKITLADQPEILLMKFLIEDSDCRLEVVLAAVKTLEFPFGKLAHHHRQPVLGSQLVEHLVPPRPERVVELRLNRFRFLSLVLLGLRTTERPWGFRESQRSDSHSQTAT